ncbi:recombinase family protein [Kitasatospora cineracea]
MTRVLVYVRISQDREGAGLGIDRQREDCLALAASRGWDVVEVFVDDDISAYSGKPRPGYKALLQAIRNGRGSAVVAWHPDRLHRSPLELEEYIDLSERHDLPTFTVTAGQYDLSTPTGRMNARIVGAVAKHESEHKATRVRRARLQSATDGKWHGGITPFGFLDDGITHNAAEAAAIRKGTLDILGGASLRSVTAEWITAGFRNSKGNPWAPNEVKDVLLRARNAGLSVYRGEVVGKGKWEPIVTEDQWRGVVRVLTDPARRTSPDNTVRWLGSHIYTCGAPGCGSVVVCSSRSSKTSGYRHSYRCLAARNSSTIGHINRRADLVDAVVEESILARLERPDAVELLRPTEAGTDVTALHAQADGLRERLRTLSAMFADGDLDAAQLKEGTARARTRLAHLEERIAAAAVSNPLAELVMAENVRETWAAWDLGRMRAVLREIMTVAIMPAPKGRQPNGAYFDPQFIKVEFRRPGD